MPDLSPGLSKQQNNPHEGRAQEPDVYLPLPHLFLTNHCECIITALSEKESLLGFIHRQ